MPPELPQNNNDVELEAILLETQNQGEVLDDIRVTNEAQVLEATKGNEELRELNSTVDMIAEKFISQKPQRVAVEINGGKEVVIEGPQGDKGDKGDKPIKGQDYFTPQEIQDIVNQVKARVKDGKDGENGQDAVVDYEAIIREVVPMIPKGLDGKDAVVDYESIIEEVLSQIPTPKDGKDGKSVKIEDVVTQLKKEDVFGEMEKRVDEAHERVNKLSSKTVSLSELDDVDLTGATITDGKYVIGGGGSGGAVDSVNGQTGVVVLDADDIDDTSTTNKFTTAGDISKLAGIEAGADVTDTTNVTAAGALMDSEVDADIKTLSLPANTTITAAAATVLDDASVSAMVNTLGGATATGSGGLVRATSPTLVTPILGTPTSGNLANCTFPTLNQNTTGSAESLTTTRTIWGQNFNGTANVTGTLALGSSSLTLTGSIGATGARATKVWATNIESTNAPTVGGTSVYATTATVTNKRVNPRTASSTTASTLTPDLSAANIYFRTTQTATLTIEAPIGTPVIGEVIVIYVDSAGAQTINFNATYIPFGAAFPATTTAGKTLMITAQYNGTNWKTLWSNAV